MVIADGIYQNLDINKYHGDPALSKSGLSVFADFSPLHYQSEREYPKSASDNMNLGSLAHLLILEPEKTKEIIRIPPPDVLGKNGARSTKAYAIWEEEVLTKTPNALIVKQEQYNKASKMRNKVFEHPSAKQLLTLGKSEISGFITLPSGVRVKCRPDHWPTTSILVDLKTARTAHPEKFGRSAYGYDYHWSAYLCCWILSELSGLSINEYYFVVVENDIPFDVTIHFADRAVMDLAKTEVQYWLKKYEYCYLSDEWPGYPKEVLPLQLPRSAYRYNPVLAAEREKQEDLSEYYTAENEDVFDGF